MTRKSFRKYVEQQQNMIGVISRIKVDMPIGKRAWRRRNGSTRHSLLSTTSQESCRTLVDIEEAFLHAAEFGDIPGVRRILQDNHELNVDCHDALGRTALRLSVKNEHLEIVELLLEKSSVIHIYEAVLQAISAGHVQIAETILKHRRYLELWKERQKLGVTDDFYQISHDDSQFSPDITPLMLAAHKNQYEIVQLLLLRGDRIQKPHKVSCLCLECKNKMKFDTLRFGKYRLNAYRALASEAYISLSSKDPVLSAFELGKELRYLSGVEKYFRNKMMSWFGGDMADCLLEESLSSDAPAERDNDSKGRQSEMFPSSQNEYAQLCHQLSEYVVKLLDRIRTQRELEMVLNKTGRASAEKYESLARLKLAIHYEEKKFAAHPSCQQRLVTEWQNAFWLKHTTWYLQVLMILLFILVYPFLVLIYLIKPDFKYVRPLRSPLVKFISHTGMFVVYLLLLVVGTWYSKPDVELLNCTSPGAFEAFHAFKDFYRKEYRAELYDENISMRQMSFTPTQLLIMTWITGFYLNECTQLYSSGLRSHLKSYYNLMDAVILSLYTCTFTLIALTMYKLHSGVTILEEPSTNCSIDIMKCRVHLYWMNADRYFWDPWDPINVSEGLFAVGNILSFSRISYLLPAFEVLGPLQISLGKMIKDILKFLVLFTLVFSAFMVGLHNLFWYYSFRTKIELGGRNLTAKAEEKFGDVLKTFRTIFWSLFGRGEPDAVTIEDYDNIVTESIGYIIYGAYNIAMVTVLVNMLIAMMARSFQTIAEDSDVEWKYSRSQLYMDYMEEGSVLPVPLNILNLPRSLCSVVYDLFSDCCTSDKDISCSGKAVYDASVVSKNGVTGKVCLENTESNSNASINNIHMDDVDGTVPTYQKVMQTIIQRYIFEIQREAEITEDDFEEIKQDISSFRYDLLNQAKIKDAEISEILTTVQSLSRRMSRLVKDVPDKSLPKHRLPTILSNIAAEGSKYAEDMEPGSRMRNSPETGMPQNLASDCMDSTVEVIPEQESADIADGEEAGAERDG